MALVKSCSTVQHCQHTRTTAAFTAVRPAPVIFITSAHRTAGRCCAAAVTRRLTVVGMASDAAAAATGHTEPSKGEVPCLSAEAVVQKQLEAYNARDIEAFMALMSDDCIAKDAVTGQVMCQGKQQLRERYINRFKTAVYSELLGRLCLGDVVVDREIITGLPDGAVADCLATYHCKGGKIVRMEFVWKPRV